MNFSRALKKLSIAFIAVLAIPAQAFAADYIATPPVLDKTRLGSLAEFWFGSPDFRFAILLATNSRVSDPRFEYIANPNQLPKGPAKTPNHVCIPGLHEAERLKLRLVSEMSPG